MDAKTILFYIFAAITVLAALRVITARNPVHSALFLVLSFFTAACIWMLLKAEFLSITLVLVYVGAVMVLFLFVVMMLDINLTVLREGFARYVPVAVVFAVLMLASIALMVGPTHFGLDKFPAPPEAAADYNNTQQLGRLMFSQYILPFEAAAVLLLVAIIAAIALTLRESRQTKAPKPDAQVRVKRADRVRLIKLPPEETP